MTLEKSTSIPEDTRRFREAYRSQVPGWYNGYVHVAVILASSLASLWVFAQFIDNPVWWEWLIVPFAVVAHSFFEWFVHIKVLHHPRKNKAFHAVFSGHALNHHRFFTSKEMRVRDHRDWRAVFFPPYVIILFVFTPLPFVAFTYLVDMPNVGWLLIFTTTSLCLLYEFVHFSQHLPDNKFLRWLPIVNTMRRHHTTHHVVSIMRHTNVNVLLPIFDWFFGTSDLNRGLFGHFFNGYNTEHVKKGLCDDMPPPPDKVPPFVEPYTEAELKRGGKRSALNGSAGPLPEPAR
ncbi:MAG: sterol desaturase family protein [Rhodospirillales bacterium]